VRRVHSVTGGCTVSQGSGLVRMVHSVTGSGLVRMVHSVTGEWASEEGALVSRGSGLVQHLAI